jgi:hypothetical protein
MKKYEKNDRVLHSFHRLFHKKSQKTPCHNKVTGENFGEKRFFDRFP